MQYAILGGGALGLGAAYRLTKAGHSVMLFEQETTPGGLAAGFQVGDAWLEKFYHHLFRTDTTAIKLIQELGLGDKLEWSHPRTVCLINGKFQQLDSPLTLLKFSPLHIHERLRVATVGALLKLTGSGLYEGKTAEPWLRKW
ncbi:MAG TPA: FAD-dependent oxidoreductase, partial [Ktedonobacteraceae bacterium]|nr:FAD-dependent oxidoreductase [Ktedonobacteraceae bacterium]